MATLECKQCHQTFEHNKRGVRPHRCPSCRANPTEQAVQPTSEEPFDLDASSESVESVKQAKKEESAAFEVFVSNIGFVYRGEDEDEAWKQFAKWIVKCKAGYGSCGFEATKFFQFGKLVKEVDPRKQWIEDHYPHLKQATV